MNKAIAFYLVLDLSKCQNDARSVLPSIIVGRIMKGWVDGVENKEIPTTLACVPSLLLVGM